MRCKPKLPCKPIRSIKIILLVSIVLLIYGCETLHYYGQAIQGQLGLLARRQAIETIIDNPETDAKLRSQLESILKTLDFAEQEMSLPAKDQYRTYVQLKHDYVVWNVVAADELSLKPHQWCYPIVGCLTYRGYFKEAAVHRKAEQLAAQGYDVYTRGVAAYSTIGWFRDPVLSSFIDYNTPSLRALILHELAHQTVYIDNDSMFNESFAVAVEIEGMRRWYLHENNSEDFQRYMAQRERKKEFIQLVMNTRKKLQAVYESDLNDNKKREEKRRLVNELRSNYEKTKTEQWQGKPYYKSWFEGPLNNAQLNSVATYYELVPGFTGLLNKFLKEGKTLDDFYEYCKELGQLEKKMRHQRLHEFSTDNS